MAKIKATGIRMGMLIEHEGRLWRVSKCQHVHVGGRGGAYMQVEMKNIEEGTKINNRFRTDDTIERPFVESREMTYLYHDGSDHVFMDSENFEQVPLSKDFLETQAGFLMADMAVNVSFHEGRPIGIELPASVAYQVVETEPNIKGATVSGSFKPAKLENGLTVMVPQFVSEGERIKVSTDTGEYLQRTN